MSALAYEVILEIEPDGGFSVSERISTPKFTCLNSGRPSVCASARENVVAAGGAGAGGGEDWATAEPARLPMSTAAAQAPASRCNVKVTGTSQVQALAVVVV